LAEHRLDRPATLCVPAPGKDSHSILYSFRVASHRARHTTASVICARRPALAFLPATVCISHTSRMLRHRSAWRFASGCTARHGDSCRACPCGRQCQRRCIWCVPTEKLPPRPLRPTLAAADRPVGAIFHLGLCQPLVAAHTAVLVGRPAELLRWAGGFLGLLLPFASVPRAATGNAPEPPCPSPNCVGDLLSSTHRGCPASKHCLFTRVAYAPPSRGLALRHCLHGSPRLILAVHTRDRAPPKSLPLMRADRRTPPLPPRPTPAAADRPLAAIFHHRAVPTVRGDPRSRTRRAAAERHRWAGGFLGLRLQLGSSRPASIGSAHEPPCPSHNRARHLRSSARLLTPASHRMHLTHAAYASPSLGLALRLCLHGSARLILAVLGRVEGTAKGIAASVCRLRSCLPGRPAQHLLQPTALSGRFSTTSCADCRLALHLTTRRAAG
jgi:hypothetical protein